MNETKTAPPRIQGYANWTHKQRQGKEGGGVAITTKGEISNKTTKVENIEDHDQEVIWIEIKTTHNNKIYIGTYYGKQEKEPRENIEREFSQLESQINKLQREAPIVLIGDVNAKIEMNKRKAYQKQSPNGKYLQQLINNQNLIPINTTSDKGTWTRVNRKNTKERSIIDYTLISKSLANNITETTTDEEGTHRIRGRNETDHNTIMVNINMHMNKQSTTIKRWKLDNNEGWKTISTNILPIVTYSGEVWKTTKKEREEINRIFDNIVKRILKTPQSTPRECLYIETGFLDPIAIINRNRLNMHNRINHWQNNTLKTILNRKEKDSWAMENKEYLQKLGIPAETM